MDISGTQQKRLDKIARLRKYFTTDRSEVYEWSSGDEKLIFSAMTDAEIAEYLGKEGLRSSS